MKREYIPIKAELAGYFLSFCRDMDVDLPYVEHHPSGDLLILGWEHEAEVDRVIKAMEKAGYK